MQLLYASEPLKVVFGISRPPYIESTPPSGISWELASEIFKRMNVKFTPFFYPNKRMEQSLLQGTADIVVEIQPTNSSLYYSKPFISYQNFIVTRKKDNITFKNWKDLSGFKVGAWQDASNNLGKAFQAAVPSFKGYEEFSAQKNQVQRWLLGSLDAIVIDETILYWWIQKLSAHLPNHKINDLDLAIDLFPVPKQSQLWWYVGFKDKKLKDMFDHYLQEIRDDGTYARIRNQYKIHPN
ncbi:substrate-binding periplasmic protein [Terasakiella pusilla]|uniref:substrate-binding periplasmic protein n=1 Tax=Terasakiella pusilla TaxID=64973 RepID=UPI00146F97A5|nr:transporter substrate-binding domain-containing protein [Terasakiella pusilla]